MPSADMRSSWQRAGELWHGLLCLAATLFLAWSIGQGTAASLNPAPDRARTFTVVAPGPGEQDPRATSNEIWVRSIVADGRRVKSAQIERTGKWEELWDTIYPTLVHRQDPTPSSLTYHGRSSIVVLQRFPWAGRPTLSCDGEPPVSPDLYGPEPDPVRLTPVGLPALDVSVLPTALAAAVLLFLLLLARPWRDPQRTRTWLALHLVALHVLVWTSQWIGTNEDVPGYRAGWMGFVAGQAGYFPPGYGAFLALAGQFPFLGTGGAAAAMQHVMMVASLLWLDRALEVLVPRPVASLWLLVTMVLSPTLFLPQTLMSENVALFSVAGTIWFTWRSARGIGRRDGLWAGLLLGFGIATRGLPVLLVPVLLLMTFAADRGRRGLMRGVWVVVVALAVTALPLGWIALHGGRPTLSTGLGRHLYNRVVCEQQLVDETGPATAQLRALVPGLDLVSTHHWNVAARLEQGRMSPAGIDQILGQVAREGMAKRPWDFVTFSLDLAWRDLTGDPCFLVNWHAQTRDREPELETPRPLVVAEPNIRWRLLLDEWFARLWLVLCWAAVVGLFAVPFLPARTLGLALAWAPTSYLLACGCLEYYLARYNVAVTPLVTALAALPLGALARCCRRRSPALPSPAETAATGSSR